MKKFLIMALLLVSANSFAQKTLQGDINVNAGFGTGFLIGTGKLSLPPLGVSLDYSISDNISIGGIAQYSQTKFDLFETADYKLTYAVVGARVNYHFGQSDKFDPYAGAMLAYNILSAKYVGKSSIYDEDDFLEAGKVSVNMFLPGIYVGGRYALGERVGLFGEIGYSTVLARVGVNFRL